MKPLSSLTAVVLPLSASIEATGRGPWSSPRTKTSTPRSPSPHQRSSWCRCCRQPARPTARCRREALGASVRGEHDVSLGTLRWWVVPLVRSGCLSDRFRPVTRTSLGGRCTSWPRPCCGRSAPDGHRIAAVRPHAQPRRRGTRGAASTRPRRAIEEAGDEQGDYYDGVFRSSSAVHSSSVIGEVAHSMLAIACAGVRMPATTQATLSARNGNCIAACGSVSP